MDADAARNEEEEVMLQDANQWLKSKCFNDKPHPKTGASALHIAASKGYIKVMKYVNPPSCFLSLIKPCFT